MHVFGVWHCMCVICLCVSFCACVALQDAVAYEREYNKAGNKLGVLTVDEFHPCQTDEPPCLGESNGNLMMANAFARALIKALRKNRPEMFVNWKPPK